MTMHDANQDGLADLVMLIPYEKIKFLIQNTDHTNFDEEDVLPPGGSSEEPWLSVADVDGDGKPELLLAQKNFLRAVVLTNEAGPGDEQQAGVVVFRQGTDQRCGQRFAHHRGRRLAQRHQRHCVAYFCLTPSRRR